MIDETEEGVGELEMRVGHEEGCSSVEMVTSGVVPAIVTNVRRA